MKTKWFLSCAVTLCGLLISVFPTFAQGSLTPPGAPAPLFKTLGQIEPRTPISSVPFTISVSGSYYLTTNLVCTVSNAIDIAASGVTLDLSGFTISSTVASAANGGTAILLGSALSDITIFNGHIRSGVTNNSSGIYSGSGFGSGISYTGSGPVNILVSRVSVTGCLYYGILLGTGDSTVVEACTVRTVGSYGIYASTIKQSSAMYCGYYAIYGDQVSDCRGQSSGNGVGVLATTVLNCYGQSSSNYGLYASRTATGCHGDSFSDTGLVAFIANSCSGSSLIITHNFNSF